MSSGTTKENRVGPSAGKAGADDVSEPPRGPRRGRLALAVAAAIAVAGLAVGAAGAGAGQFKTEVVAMTCQAEWDASTGSTYVYLFAPDTPAYPNPGISGWHPYTAGRGTGVFTASGLMLVVCAYRGGTFPSGATWRGEAPLVSLLRGGEDFTVVGARAYRGKGHVVVTPGDRTLITVVGKYVTTCSNAVCNP